MAKYRIVSRNCNPCGELRPYPWYYLQVKILNLWWVDYCHIPSFTNALESYHNDYGKVVQFYNDNCSPNRKKQKVVETVVKVFENDET